MEVNDLGDILDMRDDFNKVVGRNIARIRVSNGMAQRDLSWALMIDQSGVSNIEGGVRSLRFDEALVLAKFMGVKLDDLLEGVPKKILPTPPKNRK